MVKATIFAVATAALQVLTAERALKLDRHVADMQVVSSDANSNTLKLGFNKAVVIDLSADIKDILVADPGTVKVILRTARRVYIVGAAPGNTIFLWRRWPADRGARCLGVGERAAATVGI